MTGPSRWAAVLGSPIGHSLSPVLHRAAYRALGLDWSYTAEEVRPPELAGWLDRARGDAGFAGFSLTMPLKATAVPLLDECVGGLDVVNTVVCAGHRLIGHNTDVDGVTAAVAITGVPAGGPALVLGAGGTARAAVEALDRRGHSVVVAARRPEVARTWGVQVVGWPVDEGAWLHLSRDCSLVVATTPAGGTDPLAAWPWPAGAALVDVLYAPWPTPLAGAAQAAGATVVGGREVLLGQAIGQVRLMTGQEAPVRAMRESLELVAPPTD